MSSDGTFEPPDSDLDESPPPPSVVPAILDDEIVPSINKRKRIPGERQYPYKRRAGPTNVEYLALLNHDIEDACHSYTLDELPQILDGQVGATAWTAGEKKIFFEAVARLGKDDLRGISARLPSKSETEVAFYVNKLEEGGRSRRRRVRDKVFKSDIPAAAEISPQCCLALDRAADAVSLQVQRFEETREQDKWEEFPWNITQDIADSLDSKSPDQSRPFVELFNVPKWLELSDRVFMNASFAENNWHFVDENPPSMQSTAFEDFHNLVVSLTRRIVRDTIQVAESRIKMKGRVRKDLRRAVRRQDVGATILSLGLPRNSHKFWATSARRLKLDVHDESQVVEDGRDSGAESDADIMSHEEVEKALAVESNGDRDGSPSPSYFTFGLDGEELDPSSDSHTDSESEGDGGEIGNHLEDQIQDQVNDEEVREEAREAVLYSAVDIQNTTRAIDAVKRRIVAERKDEEYANARDIAESAREEVDLWGVVGRDAPAEVIARTHSPPPLNKDTISVDDVFERDEWREETSYVGEWEEILPEQKAPGIL